MPNEDSRAPETDEDDRHAAISLENVDTGSVSGIKVRGVDTAVEVSDAEDVEVRNISGSEEATGVVAEDSDNVQVRGEFKGFDRGFVAKNSTGVVHNAKFSNTTFGVDIRPDSEFSIIGTEFEGTEIADIVYDTPSSVQIFNTVLSRILDVSGEGIQHLNVQDYATAPHKELNDPDLYFVTYEVLSTFDDKEREQHKERLREIIQQKWEAILNGVNTASDVVTVLEALRWLLVIFLTVAAK